MAITAATRQDIIELCVIANNEAPGVTLLATLVAESEAGKSLTEIAETLATSSTFTTEYPSIQTSTEFATEFLNTLLPEVGATFVTAGIPLVEAHINGGGSIGALIAICQLKGDGVVRRYRGFVIEIRNRSPKVSVSSRCCAQNVLTDGNQSSYRAATA